MEKAATVLEILKKKAKGETIDESVIVHGIVH
jgi:hypothetical protein